MSPDPERRACARAMLREIELRVDAARDHERAIILGLAKSHAWPDVADREWIASAATDAKVDRERAEAAFIAAQELVADAFPGLDLDAVRNAIARCDCGATWAVPTRRVRGSRPGLHAHKPGAMICSICGSTGRLGAEPAPDPPQAA